MPTKKRLIVVKSEGETIKYGPVDEGKVYDIMNEKGWSWTDSQFSRADGSSHRDEFQISINGEKFVATVEHYKRIRPLKHLPGK